MTAIAFRSLPLLSAMLVSSSLLNVAEAMVAPDPINIAPSFTTSVPFRLTEMEDTTAPNGTSLYSLLGSKLNPGSDGLLATASGLGIAIIGASGNGTWQYSPDPSAKPAIWVPFGNVSASNALLLAIMSAPYTSAALPMAVRFIPAANYNGFVTSALTFRAWDGQDQATPSDASPSYVNNLTSTAYAVSAATADLTVTSVNDAPVLDTTRDIVLNSTYQGSNGNGTAISDLVASGISDVDGPTNFHLAIIAANLMHGSWEYSTTGGASWTTLDPALLTSTSVLVLSGISADGHRIRFLPSGDGFIGTISNALTVRATDESVTLALGGINPISAIGGTSAFSAASDIARITITTSGGQTTIVPVAEPAIALSGPGQTIYTTVCPSTFQGANSLLASLSGLGPTVARAFTWNASANVFVELPAGTLQPYTGVFLATRQTLSLSFDGSPYSVGFTLTLAANSWTFAGIPPIDLGVGNFQTSHPWANFSLLLGTTPLDDFTTPTFVQALGSSSAVAPTDNAMARPYWWDGTAYTQVTTLETGRGYWFKNNYSQPLSLVLNAGSQLPTTRARSVQSRVSFTGTLRDQGSPPPPPSGAQSAAAEPARGCGTGSGIAAFAMLMLLGLWSRFVGRR